jgi:hypothetical protein
MEINLRPYQQEAVAALCGGQRGLFLPYGGGKTLSSLVASTEMFPEEATTELRILVLCKAQNTTTWKDELEKWYPGAHAFQAIEGQTYTRMRAWEEVMSWYNRKIQVVAISYPMFQRHKEWFSHLITMDPHVIIADESLGFANIKTAIALRMAELEKLLPRATKMVLTGNPAPEHEMQLWTQLRFSAGEAFSRNYYSFREHYFVQAGFDYIIDQARRQEFYALLRKHSLWWPLSDIKRLREEAGYPSISYSTSSYDLSRVQQQRLQQLFSNWSYDFEEGVAEYDYTMSVLVKAQQICCGFAYNENGEPEIFLDPEKNPKYKTLKLIVADLMRELPSRKIILWRRFRVEDEILYDTMSKVCTVFVGPSDEARKAFEAYPGAAVIVMPTECCEGYNDLTCADTAIFVSADPSHNRKENAIGRTLRPSLHKHSCVHALDYFGKGSREEELWQILTNKTHAHREATS